MCSARLGVRGGGICIKCRTSGDSVLEDSRAAVLGYCPKCGGRLRGKGKGYCPAQSKNLCRKSTQKMLNITGAVDMPIENDEQKVKAGKPRPRRLGLKRSQELEEMLMVDEDPRVHRRRLEFFGPHLREQRLMSGHDEPCC